jgi:hypothetical protein
VTVPHLVYLSLNPFDKFIKFIILGKKSHIWAIQYLLFAFIAKLNDITKALPLLWPCYIGPILKGGGGGGLTKLVD